MYSFSQEQRTQKRINNTGEKIIERQKMKRRERKEYTTTQEEKHKREEATINNIEEK